MPVGILDYGIGNVGSILSMHVKLNIEAVRVSTVADLEGCERIILPGVGAFEEAIRRLRQSGMFELLEELVLVKKVPILGICLGMQMLASSSWEGTQMEDGLGWIPGEVRPLRGLVADGVKVPIMGWAYVTEKRDSGLFNGVTEKQRFYFAHSYVFFPQDAKDLVATVDYGCPFSAIVARGNVIGTQFHPEKSHRFGMSLLKQFSVWESIS
jgi:imidazole glycerol-phosphate synthase subunit HisH